MRNLKIDPEFQDKVPPLTEDEFKQLRENIISDGEIYEPIAVWNDTIVDGHNRWKIHLEFPEIPYHVREMEFADKWAAFEWMYKKQLGRRNLTEELRSYLIGKMYESRKKSLGAADGFRGNQYTNVVNPHFDDLPKKGAKNSAQIIAEEIGVGRATVERAEKFSKGVDAVREHSKEAADSILSGKVSMTKSAVQNISSLPKEQQSAVAEAIMQGDAKKAEIIALPQKAEKRNLGRSSAVRQEMEMLDKIHEQLTAAPGQTTAEDEAATLVHEIELSVDSFIASVRQTLTVRSTALNVSGARENADKTLERAINEIQKVRNLLCL